LLRQFGDCGLGAKPTQRDCRDGLLGYRYGLSGVVIHRRSGNVQKPHECVDVPEPREIAHARNRNVPNQPRPPARPTRDATKSHRVDDTTPLACRSAGIATAACEPDQPKLENRVLECARSSQLRDVGREGRDGDGSGVVVAGKV
jgi:hypothetical protein